MDHPTYDYPRIYCQAARTSGSGIRKNSEIHGAASEFLRIGHVVSDTLNNENGQLLQALYQLCAAYPVMGIFGAIPLQRLVRTSISELALINPEPAATASGLGRLRRNNTSTRSG